MLQLKWASPKLHGLVPFLPSLGALPFLLPSPRLLPVCLPSLPLPPIFLLPLYHSFLSSSGVLSLCAMFTWSGFLFASWVAFESYVILHSTASLARHTFQYLLIYFPSELWRHSINARGVYEARSLLIHWYIPKSSENIQHTVYTHYILIMYPRLVFTM